MSALDISSDVKPFCPAHHWRMATDCLGPDGTYVYRCNYDQCLVRYHAEEGYFESGRLAGHRAFLANTQKCLSGFLTANANRGGHPNQKPCCRS